MCEWDIDPRGIAHISNDLLKNDFHAFSYSLQLRMALIDAAFDHKAFHRYESGELKPRHFHGTKVDNRSTRRITTATHIKIEPSSPMKITDETKSNLGKVSVQNPNKSKGKHVAFINNCFTALPTST